jgi:signal transduction histidine kinase
MAIIHSTVNAPDAEINLNSPRFESTAVESGSDIERRKLRAFYWISLVLWLAVFVRAIVDASLLDGVQWIVCANLMLLYAVLLITEHAVTSRFAGYPALYVTLQIVIVFTLMMRYQELDFFPVLFIPVSAQVFRAFSRPSRYWWLAALTGTMAVGLLATQEWSRSFPLILLYASGYFFVASYAVVTEQAEAAERQSRQLLTDLQQAYQRLETSSAQVEALAVLEERNRIARDLHDSVSQSLYGLTLATEAAKRRLRRGGEDSLAADLESIGETAREALTEMRLLIYELRPPALEQEGLTGSLETRLNAVERRSGLKTSLTADIQERLPAAVEVELDRIAQESLNNVLKHARATTVDVTVHQRGRTVTLEIADNGIGFNPDAVDGRGMGMRGLGERAARIGGNLTIDSLPGAGTTVRIVCPL